jgi:hypothetical protein
MNLNGQLMVFCISRLNASVVTILMSIGIVTSNRIGIDQLAIVYI